jgi:hypothetical protein
MLQFEWINLFYHTLKQRETINFKSTTKQQKQKNLLPNNTTINIVLNAIHGTSLTQYVNEAKSLVTDNIPQDQYKKLSNLNYDFSPAGREFKFSATYFQMENVS